MKSIFPEQRSYLSCVDGTHRFMKPIGSFYAIFIFVVSLPSFRDEGSSTSPGQITYSLG